MITKNKLGRIRDIFVRMLGDHRTCPACGHAFIPVDASYHEGLAVYKSLKGEFSALKPDGPSSLRQNPTIGHYEDE